MNFPYYPRMAQRRHSEVNTRRSQPDFEQPLTCSLCARRRSSRRVFLGPDDILDQFICSRRDCRRFKDLLGRLLTSHPVVQINHYYGDRPSDHSDAQVETPRFNSHHSTPIEDLRVRRDSENLLAELPGECSLAGRAELSGNRIQCLSTCRRQALPDSPLPPPVNFLAKPSS